MPKGVSARITFLTFVVLVSGCNDKEPAGGLSDDYRSAPAGLAFSSPGGELTFFSIGDGRVREIVSMNQWNVTSAAINLQGNRMIVADGAHSRIGIMSLPELTEMNSVSVGGAPTDLQISANGAYAYVITHNSNFWVFSVSTGNADTLEIGGDPRRLGLRPPSGIQVWIACPGDSSVHVVSLPNLQVVEVLDFGRRPSDVVFSPDGVRAYVALSGVPGTISVLNATTFEVVDTLQAGSGPFDLAISRNGRHLVAADSIGGRARVWDLQSGEFWNFTAGGTAGRVRYSTGTSSFFVCSNPQSEIYKIDVSTGIPAVTDTISVTPNLRELILWESAL